MSFVFCVENLFRECWAATKIVLTCSSAHSLVFVCEMSLCVAEDLKFDGQNFHQKKPGQKFSNLRKATQTNR